MSDTRKELNAIGDLLAQSAQHNMQVECVSSLITEIGGMARQPTAEDIEQACANALREWDIQQQVGTEQ